MSVILDRPPVEPKAADAPPQLDRARVLPSTRPQRGFLERYGQHLWGTAIAAAVILLAASPFAVGYFGSSPREASVASAPSTLPTSFTVTASEFKFSPATMQVPVGQQIQFTLENKGVVEHDITFPCLADKPIYAAAGSTTTGEVTLSAAGLIEFICSIPGHKEAGMKGTVEVINPAAATTSQHSAATHTMAAAPSTAAAADIKPLPADLKPLAAPQVAPPLNRTEPAYVKFDLETKKVVAQTADGVAYEYWTFGDTVPGPMLRVMEGDTVEINLANAADAGVTHSVDLHAVTGPGGGAAVTQVAPGTDATFTFKALNPGVYVYHCATPMVAHHITNGMYGLIVVEPKGGLPAVEREFYLMQGGFYLQGKRGDEGLRAFDMDKMLDERPDYVLFNGSVGANTGANAFQANVGETIRIWFGVGGPNLTSSFHVIGEIFDRVYPEGALANPSTNVQTTHVPSGGATVVDFKVDVPGKYVIVDHSLGRLERGAAAQIVVKGDENPEIFHVVKSGSGGAGGH